MQFQQNVPLKDYSTMRLGGPARYLCHVTSENELIEAFAFTEKERLRLKVIGHGSNLVWSDYGFDGLVIVNSIDGMKIEDSRVEIGAGIEWDSAVAQTVEAGLSGIEFLSLIPGTTGATPVQNVGAYGREIKDVLVSLRAYDLTEKKFVELNGEDCQFGYRKSRFNREDKDRFIITKIVLELSHENPKPPFYESLQRYIDERGISDFTPEVIRNAVIAVRTAKLPDPDIVANNGSFFGNPVIETEVLEGLKAHFPDIVSWPYEDKQKLSAAWLIEKAGFKDYHDNETGMATWATQALVLINEHAKSTADLEKFKAKIIQAVQQKFGITLEQEPELVQ